MQSDHQEENKSEELIEKEKEIKAEKKKIETAQKTLEFFKDYKPQEIIERKKNHRQTDYISRNKITWRYI